MSRTFIKQEKIEEIREAADIVEVIGGYIPIKKRGKNYSGLCPFHSEKKPSFTVSPTKQLYHCFGCGASGNVISFVMRYESLSFLEALEVLASKYNIELEKEISGAREELREKILNVNDFAFGFFRKKLKESKGKKARDYLKERGISDDSIEEFGLGYAPSGWRNLLNEAQKHNIGYEDLIKAGLVVKNEKGNYYDRLRNRIIFPFFNTIGKKIGFAGRTLENDKPKYLNISETEVYKKRFTLYGLFQGKHEIRDKDKCIVVEGYMDVLALFQGGFKNTVAVSGTALTESHAKVLRRYTRNIYLSFDADKPGEKASLRSVSTLIRSGLTPYIITLKSGKDPDEVVMDEGKEKFQGYINEAEHFIDFKLRYLLSKYNLNNVVEKTEVMKEMSKTISYVKDLSERQIWLGKVAHAISVDESILVQYKKVKKDKLDFRPSILSTSDICVELAALLALKPESYNDVINLFEEENITYETSDKIIKYIGDKISKNEEIDIADVIELIDDKQRREKVSAFAFSLNEKNCTKMLNQYMNRIKRKILQDRWKRIREEIKNKRGENETIRALLKEQSEIASSLKNLGGNIGEQKRL
jgi:DNA primase